MLLLHTNLPTHPSTYLPTTTYLPTHLTIYYIDLPTCIYLPTQPPTYVSHSLVVMCQNKHVKYKN
jgi:hypothetical protein